MVKLFKKCLSANYIQVENDANYCIQREGNKLYILFQETSSKIDWKNNFDFPAKPYKDMGITWYCHRGFLRVWKSIEPYIEDAIDDITVESIDLIGYSHGSAIATICHEYIWYHRPDLREHLRTFAFGSPRFFWGFRMSDSLKERWKGVTIIRNGNDIVTHLPPVLFGFRHVTDYIINLTRAEQEEFVPFKIINDHFPLNYINSMNNYPDINLGE